MAEASHCLANESRVDAILRLMQRKRRRDDAADRGNWLGLGEIKQMAGGDKDSNRGDLITLVARGDVEVAVMNNGTFWRAYVEPRPIEIAEVDKDDGHYIIQRELEGPAGYMPRGHWFDAETYTNQRKAEAALQYAIWDAQARVRSGGSMSRVQRIRLVKL